jgi:eukaryotic translation initiation factor 2C
MSALSVCTPARYADLLCDRLRLYMKSVFDNKEDVPEGDADQVVAAYRINRNLWGKRHDGNMNPWHDKVKDIMFYL